MKTVKKEKVFVLKNRYNSDIFHTKTYNEVESTTEHGIEFIRVYKPENPGRTFLVNRAAFEILDK